MTSFNNLDLEYLNYALRDHPNAVQEHFQDYVDAITHFYEFSKETLNIQFLSIQLGFGSALMGDGNKSTQPSVLDDTR